MSDDSQNNLFEDQNLKDVSITGEMKSAYLEYAMSVIVGRALPDVRDGLKPVHRRILYSMYESGFTASKPYKKCARIVGDVLGRYHPHGDTAVYDSLVRMAQTFSLRYPLIDGQGNYGSIDGDNSAAMRYTEAKMQKLSMELLQDIEKDTVEFTKNFDESLEEPSVLPSRLPNLLLNGASGIAVGMATNIPPHNLNEVTDAIHAMLDNSEITSDELLTHVKGPDFPTGGIICGRAGIESAYRTGRGIVITRSVTTIEETKKGKKAIIVHEIPYMVNKANLIIKIAELVNDKKLNGISDLRDESDRKGMRIYIELKRDAVPEVVLNLLFKHTQMQNSFGINMVALVKGIPKTLTLKEVLTHYLEHRKEVIIRRTEYDLKLAKDRLHILEGLRIALHNIDAVIKLIKESKDTPSARKGLIDNFKLTEIQANAILEMRLSKLTGLEQDKIESEYNELLLKIKDLEDILANSSRVNSIIKEEHQEIKEKYGDERRTQFGEDAQDMNIEDLIPEHKVAVLITKKGLVKRMPVANFRSQQRGGRGVSGISTREEDIIDQIITTSTHDYLLLFTNIGKIHKIKAHQIPESSRQSKGVSVAHFLNLEEKEQVTTAVPVQSFETDDFLFMTTKKGIVKKTPVSAFKHFKTRAIIAINLDEGDILQWVNKTDGNKDVILTTTAGMIIRFQENQVRSMGRQSRGIKGIKIKPEDELISSGLIDPEDEKTFVLLITTNGYGKNIKINEFKAQGRGGIGVKALKFRKTVPGDKIVDGVIAEKEDDVMIVTKNGVICRQKIANISIQKRQSQGVKIMKLDGKDSVLAIAKVYKEEDVEDEISSTETTKETSPKTSSKPVAEQTTIK